MLACAQINTGGCSASEDFTEIGEHMAELEMLVGAQCGTLGIASTDSVCRVNTGSCSLLTALDECTGPANTSLCS